MLNFFQALLCKDNDNYKLKFTAITLLVKSIIYILEQKTADNKIKAEKIEREIQSELAEKNLAAEKTEIEEIEKKVTVDIINDVTDNYGIPSPPPLPQINQEIDKERIKETRDYLQIQLQMRYRDHRKYN